MVYRRYARRRTYKKRNPARRGTFAKKVARIAKTVALRTAETKHFHRTIATSIPQYHNVWQTYTDNLLHVPATGSNDNRTGDQIILRGIKLYMYFEHPVDRPNVNWRIVVGKLPPNASGTIWVKNLTARNILDPLDMDHYSKVYRDIRFNLLDDSYGNGVDAPKKYSRCKIFYIPLNNLKYNFENHTTANGRDWEMQLGIVCYDADNTMNSDIIGTCSVASVLYFKDP